MVMKKIILTTLLLVFGAHSYAAEPPIVKVNCDDVKLSLNTTMDNRLNFSAYWNDEGTFPNPPKYTEIGDTHLSKIKKFRIECPDFSASYDGNVAEIKAKEGAGIFARISGYDKQLNLFSISGYKYPNIKQGFFNSSYSINLDDLILKTSIYEIKQGDDLNNDILKYHSIKKDSIIGYKIDGGELKPLLYDRKVSNYIDDFNRAKTIDIFHKISSSNAGVIIQRIFIDKENDVLRIYAKSPFPSN